MRSLSYAFRIGHSTVSEIVRETCEKIFETLSPIYLKQPDSNGWKKIANEFLKIWNFPNCIGAGDGKHFAIPVLAIVDQPGTITKVFTVWLCSQFAMPIIASL